jgi:hypothetical protein
MLIMMMFLRIMLMMNVLKIELIRTMMTIIKTTTTKMTTDNNFVNFTNISCFRSSCMSSVGFHPSSPRHNQTKPMQVHKYS